MTALLDPVTLTTAVSATPGPVLRLNGQPRNLTIQATFAYGSGGTTADAYVQCSLDAGASWIDIVNFHFTTSSATKIANLSALTPVTTLAAPSDGSLASNTAVDGILSPRLRVKYQSSGTYGGTTTLRVDIASDQLS